MPSSFPTPERCLLEQAARWFIDGTMPIPDEVYQRAPVELKAENSELRELFLVLLAEDCDVRGNLEVNFIQNDDDPPFEKIKKVPTPPNIFTLTRDVKILTDTLLFRLVNFRDNKIGSWISRLDDYDKGQFEKISQKYPEHEAWATIFSFRNVTVDFSKLSANRSGVKDGTPPPVKRGAPPKYNWDLIWAELVVRADLDNLPSTQAECIRNISEWCIERYGDAPSETTLKEKLKYVYGHHRKVGK